MPRIHILSDRVVSQIAAGEVVERPASVVKELVENALDAGATTVRVELEAGGRRLVAVADDGCGMGRDDALLAFDRHATSKIAAFEDLERVGTLGFRGEALSSIAAVARVELLTAERPGEGQRVRIEGGRVLAADPAPLPRGTRIEVRSLFWNVPARRKFLKAPATELRRSLEVVQGYVLARPEVRFEVVHEGRELLVALPAASPRERIAQLFGAEFTGRLVEIEPSGRGGRGGVSGLIGAPATAGARRAFVFVNRRLLRDRAVLAAFYRAVREEWRSDEFPALFLFLDLPAEEVDVNVHPQKAEVRFRDAGLLDRVHLVLRAALARARGEEPAPLRAPAAAGRPPVPLAWQGFRDRKYPAAGEWEPRSAGTLADAPVPMAGSAGARLAVAAYAPLDRAAVSVSSPLSGRGGEPRPFRLLGQYKGTLILLEGPDGLYLIDQHVAHERILYERLRRELSAEAPESQALLTPALLELAPDERLRLLELSPGLERCGFGLTTLSGGTLALTAVPAALSAAEGEALLRTLASDETAEPGTDDGAEAGTGNGADDGAGARPLRRRLVETLAASLACKAAVNMHHPLSPAEMEALVAELFAAEQPYACPHGRPVVLQMTDSDLERRFGRR